MKAWGWAVAAAALGVAGAAGAGGFAPPYGTAAGVAVPASGTPEGAGLERLRFQGPQVGRDTVAVVNGVPVATIEWSH